MVEGSKSSFPLVLSKIDRLRSGSDRAAENMTSTNKDKTAVEETRKLNKKKNVYYKMHKEYNGKASQKINPKSIPLSQEKFPNQPSIEYAIN